MYPEFVLGPLDADLREGVTYLVGANGAGKSTFMRALAGVEGTTWGARVAGAKAEGTSRVGYLPQDLELPRRATCRQHLDHMAWVFGVARQERATVVDAALDAAQLADRSQDRISTLSGGMLRRLGLAQVLVQSPDLILLDEPAAGLDPLQRLALRQLVAQLARTRVVLVSTHLVEDVAAGADHVLVLRRGQLVFDGGPDDLARLDTPEALGGSPLERAVSSLISEPARPAQDDP